MIEQPTKRRLRSCVESWPECETGAYDPRCCRFPKSCSCTIYDEQYIDERDLEPEQRLVVADPMIVAEVLRRLADIIGSLPMRADANVNQGDLYRALNDAYHEAFKEAQKMLYREGGTD